MLPLKKTLAALGLTAVTGLIGCQGHCGSHSVCEEEVPCCECQQQQAAMYPTYQAQPQYDYGSPGIPATPEPQPAPPAMQPQLTTPPAPGPINPAPPAEPGPTSASFYRTPGVDYPGRSYQSSSYPYPTVAPQQSDSLLHRMGSSVRNSFDRLRGQSTPVHQTSTQFVTPPVSEGTPQTPQPWPYHHAARSGLIVPR